MESSSPPFFVSVRIFDRGCMHIRAIVYVTYGTWWSASILRVLLHRVLLSGDA